MTSELLDKINEEAKKKNTTKNRIVAECIEKQLFDSKEIPQITVETID